MDDLTLFDQRPDRAEIRRDGGMWVAIFTTPDGRWRTEGFSHPDHIAAAIRAHWPDIDITIDDD